ncbi:hypothetical protein D1007_22943 [Hordeum vulgare]|nr:hypothetical protein D1007_22943 [Hordeum vulgare]
MDHLLNIKPPLTLPAPSTSTGNLKLRASTEAVLKARQHLHAFVVKHAGRLAGALAGARSALLALLLDARTSLVATKLRRRRSSTKARKKSKEPCCSAAADGGGNATPTQYLNLLPDGAVPSWSLGEPSPTEAGGDVASYYYDPSWNAVIPAEQLSPMTAGRCLECPEEDGVVEEGGCNEIDRLAERFIARCHERFVLEKQASFRRFQEMLARSF